MGDMGGMAGTNMSSPPPMHSPHSAMAGSVSYMCDGSVWMDMGEQKAGTWTGHFLPGLILLVWSLHWMQGVFGCYLATEKQHGSYRSRATYSLPLLPAKLPLEGILKVLVPFFAILSELWWTTGHWRSSICPEDTPRAGHFYITHLSSWQNAWVLAAFMFSGVLDVASVLTELPEHCEHLFLAVAFALESFVLSQGEHADMLVDMMYYLLYLVSAAACLFTLGEIVVPDSFWMSVGRVYSTLAQAIWYFAAAHILYGGRVAWNTTDPVPDMGPAMFLPVVFVFWLNMTALIMLTAFLCARWWHTRWGASASLKSNCCVERTLQLEEHTGEHGMGGAAGSGGHMHHHKPSSHLHSKVNKDGEMQEMTPLISKLV